MHKTCVVGTWDNILLTTSGYIMMAGEQGRARAADGNYVCICSQVHYYHRSVLYNMTTTTLITRH